LFSRTDFDLLVNTIFFLIKRERDFVFDIYECLVRFVESTRENKVRELNVQMNSNS